MRIYTFDAAAFGVDESGKGPNGNANENVVVTESNIGAFAHGFEYYAFKSGDLTGFATDASQKDKRVINKVRVRSDVTFLSDVKFGIRVSDVTQALAGLDHTMHQGPPEVQKNVETGKADTVANKSVAITFQKGEPADSVFDVVYNTDTKELGIKLKPDYAGTSRHVVYKVDVIVASATVADSPDEDSVMALQYAGGYRIRSLGESIRLAIRDVVASMPDRVLHTFYIDITP
jgi:hypothetical protein